MTQRTIIIDQPFGRLGNTLCRLGNILAYAKENSITVWDRSMVRTRNARLFPRVRQRLLLRYPDSLQLPVSCRPLHSLQARWIERRGRNPKFHTSATDSSDHDLLLERLDFFPPGQNTVVLRGFHYYADDCVTRQAAYLRKLFTPDRRVVERGKAEASRMREGVDRLVALHIRRGDYQTWEGGQYFFDMSYYREVADQVVKVCPGERVRFIVCSDDAELDLGPLGELDCERVTRHSSVFFDWYLMSRCDLLIGTVHSTYPAWASFYGEVPIFRLRGENVPESFADFIFRPTLNVSMTST